MMTDPNGIRCWPLLARFALLAAILLSSVAFTYAVSQGVTSCAAPRLPDGESIREGPLDWNDYKPFPLPTVDVGPGGNFSSAEYGVLDWPYTTAAAYGAQYSSGSIVETYEPTRNLPCVTVCSAMDASGDLATFNNSP